MIRRSEAKMIAEELFSLIRNDCNKVAKEYVATVNECYLNIQEAADIIGWSTSTLYKKKDMIGAYTKIGNQLRFPKSVLLQLIREGKLKSKKK